MKKLFEGKRSDNISWEFFESHLMPTDDLTLITQAFSFVFKDNQILLTKHYCEKRWREALGWHTEEGESPRDSAHREIVEEWGISVKTLKLIGYIKITAKKPKPNKRTGWFYPFPHAYGLYYVGETNKNPWEPSCGLIEKAEFFNEEEALNLVSDYNKLKVKYAFEYYRQNFQSKK